MNHDKQNVSNSYCDCNKPVCNISGMAFCSCCNKRIPEIKLKVDKHGLVLGLIEEDKIKNKIMTDEIKEIDKELVKEVLYIVDHIDSSSQRMHDNLNAYQVATLAAKIQKNRILMTKKIK